MVRPRIITTLETKKDKVIKAEIKDTVKEIGNSGYISLPKDLIGKYVLLSVEVIK